ncbi:Lipopolysaccharide core heptosyltransferase I, partial [hydrothermal vent metagenome]
EYDLVLDAQGLLKSAWVARKVAKKNMIPLAGYDWSSIREPLASLCYTQKQSVSKDLHAIERIRQLFCKTLGYDLESHAPIVYGLDTTTWHSPSVLPDAFQAGVYWVFLHGTTWESKYWPEAYWVDLLARANAVGRHVVLPWGNEEERLRALRIAETSEQGMAWVPEQPLSLNTVAQLLKYAQGVVSVDTGLSHVAAALDVPMVVMYRVTDPKLVGADGSQVIRLASPCAPDYLKQFPDKKTEAQSLEGLSVENVFQNLMRLMRLR